MSERRRPSELPGWPRRLGLPLAAAYLGISPTRLLDGEGKTYPAAAAVSALAAILTGRHMSPCRAHVE